MPGWLKVPVDETRGPRWPGVAALALLLAACTGTHPPMPPGLQDPVARLMGLMTWAGPRAPARSKLGPAILGQARPDLSPGAVGPKLVSETFTVRETPPDGRVYATSPSFTYEGVPERGQFVVARNDLPEADATWLAAASSHDLAVDATAKLVSLGLSADELGSPRVKTLMAAREGQRPRPVAKKVFFERNVADLPDPVSSAVVTYVGPNAVAKVLLAWPTYTVEGKGLVLADSLRASGVEGAALGAIERRVAAELVSQGYGAFDGTIVVRLVYGRVEGAGSEVRLRLQAEATLLPKPLSNGRVETPVPVVTVDVSR